MCGVPVPFIFSKIAFYETVDYRMYGSFTELLKICFIIFHAFFSWNNGLCHGCARVTHCVTARWRNFSHYCRPLRHCDVWLRVLITEKHWQPRRQHTVYRNKLLEFATEQVGKLRYVTAVAGGLKRFPWVAWFAHPWSMSSSNASPGIFWTKIFNYLYSFGTLLISTFKEPGGSLPPFT